MLLRHYAALRASRSGSCCLKSNISFAGCAAHSQFEWLRELPSVPSYACATAESLKGGPEWAFQAQLAALQKAAALQAEQAGACTAIIYYIMLYDIVLYYIALDYLMLYYIILYYIKKATELSMAWLGGRSSQGRRASACTGRSQGSGAAGIC